VAREVAKSVKTWSIGREFKKIVLKAKRSLLIMKNDV
jgi:hypothetical protein